MNGEKDEGDVAENLPGYRDKKDPNKKERVFRLKYYFSIVHSCI